MPSRNEGGFDTPLHIGTNSSENVMFLGAIQKVCHRPRGEGGSSKIVAKGDKGEGGSNKTEMSPLSNFQEKFS